MENLLSFVAMPPNSNHVAKLTKAPLQEVIFELFWELDIDPQMRQSHDPGFELAQGVFAELVKERFPFYKRVAPPIPVYLLNHRPIHQFWRGENEWPVVQLGPGLLATNDTEKTYVWDTEFLPVVEYALDAVLKSYKESPRFQKVSLRYIDAVELRDEFENDFVTFVETNLQVRVVRNFEVGGTISDLNLNQVFSLNDGSKLQLVISNGQRDNKPAVVWQTAVVREKHISVDEIMMWISDAHSVTSSLFKRMLREDFYDSLK